MDMELIPTMMTLRSGSMQKYHPKILISGPQSRLTAWLLGLVLTSQGYGQLYVLANLAWGEHTAAQQNLVCRQRSILAGCHGLMA